jgi:hypothetical protein
MYRIRILLVMAVFFQVLTGCGGGSTPSNPAPVPAPQVAHAANITGMWEFTSSSTTHHSPPLIEVDFLNYSQNSSDPTHATVQASLQLSGFQNPILANPTTQSPFGSCLGAEDQPQSLVGDITSQAVVFTLADSGQTTTLSGTFNAGLNGLSTAANGSYSSAGPCGSDSGTFSGVAVSPMIGTYTGIWTTGESASIVLAQPTNACCAVPATVIIDAAQVSQPNGTSPIGEAVGRTISYNLMLGSPAITQTQISLYVNDKQMDVWKDLGSGNFQFLGTLTEQ